MENSRKSEITLKHDELKSFFQWLNFYFCWQSHFTRNQILENFLEIWKIINAVGWETLWQVEDKKENVGESNSLQDFVFCWLFKPYWKSSLLCSNIKMSNKQLVSHKVNITVLLRYFSGSEEKSFDSTTEVTASKIKFSTSNQ